MLIFLGFIALIAGGVALVLLPLRLPWQQRVRWMVAADALGWSGLPTELPIIREVFVVDIYDGTPALRVVLRPAGTALPDTTLVVPDSARLSTAPQLARWRAAGTPLLLVSDGGLSLHGPNNAVCGLSASDAGVQEETPWSSA